MLKQDKLLPHARQMNFVNIELVAESMPKWIHIQSNISSIENTIFYKKAIIWINYS